MIRTSLAFAAVLMLGACSESAEERTPDEAAEAAAPQETQFTGDIDSATAEAVADTQAAEAATGPAAPAPAPADEGAATTADAGEPAQR